MTSWTERFFGHLRVERGLTESTIAQYVEILERFRVWLAKPLPEANGRDIRKYLARDVRAKRKPNSTARTLSCLRQFYGFLVAEGGIRVNPTRHIRHPRIWRRVPEVLSPEDIQKLVSFSSILRDPLRLRDRAMVLTYFSAGLRNSELRSLEIPDSPCAGLFGFLAPQDRVQASEKIVVWVSAHTPRKGSSVSSSPPRGAFYRHSSR